jgi:DNA-binding transcriptional MerR regulator
MHLLTKMPWREKETEKVYWTIAEVAEMFGLATSALRFWETKFDNLHPKKNKNGNRQYTKSDIVVIAEIHVLVKVKGFTLWGAKKQLSLL